MNPQAILFIVLASLLPERLAAIAVTDCFPASDAFGVDADTPLRIVFDQVPVLGTTGAVTIHQVDGTLVDQLEIGVSQTRRIAGKAHQCHHVLITGNTATIFPRAGVLKYNTTYHVNIDGSVFNGFGGIAGNATWRFTTKPVAPSATATQIIVAADGSGDFCTVQGAVDLIPAHNTTPRTINIRNGIYQEIIRIRGKHHLVFRGEHRGRTIICYPNNDRLNPGTDARSVCDVIANDISFERLTLRNTTAQGGSQAEALRVSGQRCLVDQCDLRSYQDTLLVNSEDDSAYLKDSLIEGDVDFIWGSGKAVFKNCEIRSLASGYICQMRNPAGSPGAVFLDCRFTRSLGVTNVLLARIDPNDYPASSVSLIDCAMDSHITEAAWQLSAPGPISALRFMEYRSTDPSGTLLNVAARAGFSRQIDASQAGEIRNACGFPPKLDR